MLKRTSVVTVASHALKDYTRSFGVSNVIYVPNGISKHFLKKYDGRILRRKLGHQPHDLVIGYIGSIEFWLDMKTLIKGVSLIRKKGLSAKLLLVGKKLHTKYSEKVVKWLKNENLEKHTLWLDFVPYEKVPEFMAEIDVGTIPFDLTNLTAFYAAPNKLWEYLSQRKPVVSTPIPEVLRNSNCILKSVTAKDCAHNLSLIAKNEEVIRKKVEIGYKKALTKTWDNSTDILKATICSLFNKK
jgi:glycosyltransferase involved in cell wall biosynthesis